MKIKVIHETSYQYNAEVFLEPHYFRFKPKNTPHIEVESYAIHYSPKPMGHRELLDPENNIIDFCWFEGMHKELVIRSEFIVFIREHNPLNFILHPQTYFKAPFLYGGPLMELLHPSLKKDPIGKSLVDFGINTLKEVDGNSLEFLITLTRKIFEEFVLEIREEGPPLPGDETFQFKRGSCRDLAWMQIQLLRHFGMAARFVSGYFFIPEIKPTFELHGWLEVFLPGGGWIGLDPSHGMVSGLYHVPLASSSNPINTMTVTGSVRGGASSELKTNLIMEEVP